MTDEPGRASKPFDAPEEDPKLVEHPVPVYGEPVHDEVQPEAKKEGEE